MEKGKVKSKVAFVFSLVDQFLVRSLRLEKHPNKQQHLDLISSEILLLNTKSLISTSKHIYYRDQEVT